MNRNIALAFILFFVAQTMIWYQTNSQFLSNWAKERPLLIACMGIPISYILINATKFVVLGFDGLLWPGRLIGFSSGMLIMAICTYLHLGEGITLKTGVTLSLAFLIVLIQLYWK
jgi:hypothetical protein